MTRSFKILRLAGLNYAPCIVNLLHKQPDFINRSFANQQELLFEQAYTYGDSFSDGMRVLGHDAREIVYDFEIMQKTWAKEVGCSYREQNWQIDILLAQILHFKPDILYLQDIHCLPDEIRNRLKERFSFIKLLVIFRGFPGCRGNLLENLSKADLVLVGSPHLLNRCQLAGIDACLVYHFFDERILSKVHMRNDPLEQHDFTFIGSSGFGYGLDHAPRYWMLRELLDKTSISLWIDEVEEDLSMLQKLKRSVKESQAILFSHLPVSWLLNANHCGYYPKKIRRLFRAAIEKQEIVDSPWALPPAPLRLLFPEKCYSPTFGLSMYEKLAQSKVSFNKHSTPAIGSVDNIRLFQCTGMGSCLLTDTGSNMSELFEPDREVVTYKSLEECLEKLRYLRENEKIRIQIAKKGQIRTLQDHTARIRCQQIHELIQKKTG